jgi:glycosyltransferase involved in cell wall biosynthesis
MEKSKKIIILNDGLVQNENFIIFGEDFARHPHALEHVLRPLFPTNRFLWVETIGLRSPKLNLYDFKRILEKIGKWFFKEKNKSNKLDIPQNIFIISPFMIPFNQFSIIRKFNKWNVVRKTQQALIDHKMNNPITIASVPNACDFIGSFGEILKIYYCVDEFSLWPGLDKNFVESLEKKLIINADLIVATSDFLAKSKTIKGKITPVITHGVDFEHFNIGAIKEKNTKLKLCYFGLFDERSDQFILKEIAENISNCEIHIFGDVVCNIKLLNSLSNVIFHGKINYHQLPTAIAKMDIFLLPYVRNDLTNNINPLKLKEYLSTGRPVIATELPEVVKLENYLFLGKNSTDFISIIRNLQSNDNNFNSDSITLYIKTSETWDAKARQLCGIIQKGS